MTGVEGTCQGRGCGVERTPAPGLPLSPKQISDLAREWPAGDLWLQVDWAAGAWWSADPGTDEALRAWAHLLLAVGNFKRQSPIRNLPVPVPFERGGAARPAVCALPGRHELIACGEPASWNVLTGLPGVGVATATTLLSALWPGCHAVIDVLSRVAAAGLALPTDQAWFPDPSSTDRLPPMSLEHYQWYRGVVLRTARVSRKPVVDVERALFTLAKRSRRKRTAEPRSWLEYRAALVAQLEATGPHQDQL